MSHQPEMQPPGQPGEDVHGDLTGKPFPLGDWGEPAERLDELYRWVETGALRTAEWYLSDRVWKRRCTAWAVATSRIHPEVSPKYRSQARQAAPSSSDR